MNIYCPRAAWQRFWLIGLALGLILSIPTGTDALSIIAVTVIFGYLGVTGFWGAYNIDRWFRKYRYRMPKPAWYVLRVLFIILGIIGGALDTVPSNTSSCSGHGCPLGLLSSADSLALCRAQARAIDEI